ncbi:saccharopine dehydrogenase family protein [Pseudomonas mucidolens]|uniref:Uncharacterized conserved protein n=1 Tax=Pseudomonas mucidolens TaxID=46679 RepID=A0A1H2NR26_9PSED|nr:saccharopine dehydrogenase NADP-binding domain-containing protein [Pseudomonas mucidolens]SDV07834.1 Uncharacterized conserved protein [Pseudomonas mucidolens]SQH31271.1 integral membrane protein [Pseudomonas mucidolens]
MKKLLIYGAAGYTGSMVAEQAKAAGLNVEIAGRDAAKLQTLAERLDVPYRVFSLDGPPGSALAGVDVLLNCAGPFAHTAQPLMYACIEAGVSYLDITAEINVYRLAERLSVQAAKAGVMLLPGVGWDVVPTDCLAMHVAQRVRSPQSLRVALQVAGSMSRGSAISASEIIGAGLMARVEGRLVATPAAQPELFDFGDGPVLCAPLSFGDLITSWHSSAIPNIAMYVHVTGDAFPTGDLAQLLDGPSAEQRLTQPARAVAEVTAADGTVARSVIGTVNGYSYTPLAAVEAARRVLGGEVRQGFATPAQLFGVGFAESIPGTWITDV